jgi:hypothetical protein
MPLCGAGPGLYLDFATFNFHVPEKLSAANTAVADTSTTSIAIQISTRVLVI